MNLLSLLASNKHHVAAYLVLIAMGVAGYTNLLLELGELRATVKYQEQVVNYLTDKLAECNNG